MVRCASNEGRSAKKSVVEAERVWRGVRVSLEMVAMIPRWEGEETRSLKAEWSSWETVIPDCIMVIYGGLMKGGCVADGPPVKCKLHARHQSLARCKQPRHTNGARPHMLPSDLDMALTCFIHISHSHWHTLTPCAS